MRSDTSKHKDLRCPISRNSLSGFLLFIVQVPKNQRCVQQLVGPQVGVSTAGQMLQSREPGGRPQWGGHVLPGCAAPALPPARVRRVWERAVGVEGLSRSPARAEGGWVVFRVSLKFLPLLSHEEMVSQSDGPTIGKGQAGRVSPADALAGRCLAPCSLANICIIKGVLDHPGWVAAWKKRRACSSAQLCAARASLAAFPGALVSSGE